MAVDVSEHSIDAKMVVPNADRRAWDDGLYRSGCLFVDGYANPIKPRAVRAEDREELDEVEDATGHTKLVSSNKYQDYQDQHLISEMAKPQEQWKTLLLVAAGAAVVTLMNLILLAVIASAVGVF